MNGKNEFVHRVSWIIYFGKIPYNLHVLHHCDNPLCVNPNHLWLGTQKDNNEDMMNKGRNRQLSGEEHPMAILTEKDILQIRGLYNDGYSMGMIAPIFNITKTNVSRIVNGHIWDKVGGPLKPRRARSILTEAEVREIRVLYKYNNLTYKELSKKYNVSRTQIGRIIQKKRWTSIL